MFEHPKGGQDQPPGEPVPGQGLVLFLRSRHFATQEAVVEIDVVVESPLTVIQDP